MPRALLLILLLACGDDEPLVSEAPIGPPAGFDELQWGEQLYATHGCVACHRIDSGPSVGPALNGLLGQSRTLTDGRTVTVDSDYLRESIETPETMQVPGYEQVPMPAYGNFDPAELDALVGYLQHLSPRAR